MVASNAEDATQSIPNMLTESHVVELEVTTSKSVDWTKRIVSDGRIRDMKSRVRANMSVKGIEPNRAERKISPGNIARAK